MTDFTPSNRYRKLFTLEEEHALPSDKPYLYHICYMDWTDHSHHHIMHMHKDIVEIVLFLKGHGEYRVGEIRYPVEAGDVILCNSQISHDEIPAIDVPYRTIAIGIKNLNIAGLDPNMIITDCQNPHFHFPKEFDALTSLFLLMDRYIAEKNDHYQKSCESLMESVLLLINQMVQTSGTCTEPKEDHLSSQIESYINDHYTEDLTLEQLSKMFFISPYHLSHMFKSKTGYSLKQYILRRRIGEAQTLLSDTSKSIRTIASEIGFHDSLYFSRIFTKYIGLSPSQYRQTRKKEF